MKAIDLWLRCFIMFRAQNDRYLVLFFFPKRAGEIKRQREGEKKDSFGNAIFICFDNAPNPPTLIHIYVAYLFLCAYS